MLVALHRHPAVRRWRTVAFVFICAGLVGRDALAQRRPVLEQIHLPHSYYYREMYLPQATSGPSAVAWSPDGREVVFSMQGSLWTQALDSTLASQITNGSGY